MSKKGITEGVSEKKSDLSPDETSSALSLIETEKLNWAKEIPTEFEEPTRRKSITPRDRLDFAQKILLGAALIFILGMCLAVGYPTSGEKIFDVCKTVLPPIATLVIGYYFSRNNND